MTTDGVEGNGTPFHSEWKGKFDGKDYEITGDPDANMRSYKKMNDRTLSMTAKKGNEVVAYGLIVVSADGKSQDVTLASLRRCDERLQRKKTRGGKKCGNGKRKGLGTRPFTTKNNPLGPILTLTGNQWKLSLDYAASSV